jgi:putative transport protein
MTDPPALAFATGVTKSDQPLVAYAAVYPLIMILRVFIVQVLILTLPW